MRNVSRRDAIAPLAPRRGEGLGVRGRCQYNQRIHCSPPTSSAAPQLINNCTELFSALQPLTPRPRAIAR